MLNSVLSFNSHYWKSTHYVFRHEARKELHIYVECELESDECQK